MQTVVYFLDQASGSPVAGNLTVTIYGQGAAQIPQNVLASGTIAANGSSLLDLPGPGAYTAVFSGSDAPTYAYNFTLGAPTAVVSPGPMRKVQTGVAADGSVTLITFPSDFSNYVDSIFLSIGANYTGTDNASLNARLSGEPTVSGFSVIVSGGQPGTTVDLHYGAYGA